LFFSGQRNLLPFLPRTVEFVLRHPHWLKRGPTETETHVEVVHAVRSERAQVR
jgi:hypothetical protein